MAIDKAKTDVSAIFLTYMALVGDVERTALAFNLDPADVSKLAESEGWAEKIRRVSLMSKSGKPGDFERAQNRALCFVQAHQIRTLVNRLSKQLLGIECDEDFLQKISVSDKNGFSRVSAKVLTDLCTAAEACHRMSYAALGDTVSERLERVDEKGEATNVSEVHAAIIAALNNPATGQLKPAQLMAGEREAIVESSNPDNPE
jgi:hypothetical protein